MLTSCDDAANILAAKAPNEEITFIAPEERAAFDKWSDKSFAVQVANHEVRDLQHASASAVR